ncbi:MULTISPECIES: WD40 repeat domain-containing serine/threonine protein kinase [unclassified Pseudofrankia]|uniref:WD40 repeat domain-containing serine/threonine protein kinase n=1 Tax=unclassified Pseudofrankia TaxID=2994372 RepID=UPI0008DB104F|nr:MULTISPECIES: serine/threonine-protein kinase [unclassified Pseudofrankia]MDT3440251.1 serine/threonine-protein kinase [Pseudofrankia sp. BMG5.37]OHV73530.1 hypothetical protein BCD48_33385 [Pseudofrankia sp. BMG5.36]
MAVVPGVAPLDETDPATVGPYRLLGRLGDGGMGSVYLARRRGSTGPGPGGGTRPGPEGPQVALKVIRPDLARIPQFRERFLREAQAARKVAQFCTAEVLDVSTEGSRPYLVTEYIDGPTLGEAVRERGPMPATALERLAVAVASALTAIHAAGVVHRDLKPGNILLSSSGARVIDFGIARALDATTMLTHGSIGTPGFMAPEQALGRPVTAAADIYAWGAVILFAATGRPPFGEGPTPAVLHRVVTETPNFASIAGALRSTVARAMAKSPAERPTADELLLLLHRVHTAPRTARGAPPPPGSDDATDVVSMVTTPLPPIRRGPAAAGRVAPPASGTAAAGWSPRPPAAAGAPGSARRRASRRRLVVAIAAAVLIGAAVPAIILATADRNDAADAATASTSAPVSPSTPTSPPRVTTAETLARVPPSPFGEPLTGRAFTMAFSPDGRTLATIGNGAVSLWDVNQPDAPALLGKPFGIHESWAVPYFLDGHTLATAGQSVRFWDVTDPTSPTAVGKPLPSENGSTAVTADGHTLAVSNEDGAVQLWDVTSPANPEAVGKPIGRAEGIVALAFSADGHRLAVGAGDGTIRLWDITDSSSAAPVGGAFDSGGAWLVAFSPDGGTLAAVGAAIRFWDLTDPTGPTPLGQPIFDVPSNGGFDIVFSPDGSTLVSADGADGGVHFWDVTDPSKAAALGWPLTGGATGSAGVAFSPDGHVLAALVTAGDSSAVRLWNLH